jgi:hypothetical protein
MTREDGYKIATILWKVRCCFFRFHYWDSHCRDFFLDFFLYELVFNFYFSGVLAVDEVVFFVVAVCFLVFYLVNNTCSKKCRSKLVGV